MEKILLIILMSLVPHFSDTETKSERRDRMGIISKATTIAVKKHNCIGRFKHPRCKKLWPGKPEEEAVALIAHGQMESHFAERVHAGKCKSYECDPYRYINKKGKLEIRHRARNVFQVQASGITRVLWERSLGNSLEATTNAARISGYYLAKRYCGGNALHMFSAQGGGGCIETPEGKKKTDNYWRYLAKYRKLERKMK